MMAFVVFTLISVQIYYVVKAFKSGKNKKSVKSKNSSPEEEEIQLVKMSSQNLLKEHEIQIDSVYKNAKYNSMDDIRC